MRMWKRKDSFVKLTNYAQSNVLWLFSKRNKNYYGCKLKDLANEYNVSMTTIGRVLTLKERNKNEN